jgi:hypothetical protein
MNRNAIIILSIIAGLLLGLLFFSTGAAGKVGVVGVATLFGLFAVELWHPRPARERPDETTVAHDTARAIVSSDVPFWLSPFWLRATQIIFRNVLRHVADLSGGAGVQIGVASELLQLDYPNLTSLNSALLSSDDEEIRSSWRLFTKSVNEDVLEKMFVIIRIKTALLPDAFIPREGIDEYAAQIQF